MTETKRTTTTSPDEFDVEGHYLLHELHGLEQAAQRSREADAWSRSQVLRREAQEAGSTPWHRSSRTRLAAVAAPIAALIAVVAISVGAIA